MYYGASCDSGTISGSSNGCGTNEGSKRPRTEVDRLSSLPDSLLLHILSFLPTKDAVATALVPPFRGLWKHLRHLTFRECDFCCSHDGPDYDATFLRFVEHVLTGLESPTIDSLNLCMDFYISGSVSSDERHGPMFEECVAEERRMAKRLDKWVCCALEKKVKVLDLDLGDFSDPIVYRLYRLPSTVLCSDSLVELTLYDCSIKHKGPIRLKSLRKLFLWGVRLRGETVTDMISGSPLLRELTLHHCFRLQILKVDWHTSLETLNIRCPDLRRVDFKPPCIKRLTISIGPFLRDVICPNVDTLHMSGSIESVNWCNLSSVIDVSLDFGRHFTFKGASKEHRKVKMLLQKLCGSACFTLCECCMQVFTMWEVINQPCPSLNWKHGTITLYSTKWHLPGISCLLRACNYLEMLSICVERPLFEIFKPSEEEWTKKHDLEGEDYWKSVDTFVCLKHHLKNVKICGYVTEPCVQEVIRFLLGRALILEKMVISVTEACPWYAIVDERLQLSRKVLSFPRASARAVVHIRYASGNFKKGLEFSMGLSKHSDPLES